MEQTTLEEWATDFTQGQIGGDAVAYELGRGGRLSADLERVRKLLLDRYKVSYRFVMFFYRFGRLLRRQQSVADGAAPAITVE